jgi:hypothetical protein
VATRRRSSPLTAARVYAERALGAWAENRRWVRRDRGERFLVLRHFTNNAHAFDPLLHWLAAYAPAVRARFELRVLPTHVADWSRYALMLPWLQDPVQQWSPRAYDHANRLAAACETRGIPMINRVDRLANAGKRSGAERIARAGLRTARMVRIDDAARFRATRDGLALPLFVREDWGHGGRMLRADTDADVRALPIESFARPLAVELLDVRGADGLYRKYRYVVAGDTGVPLSLHVQRDWIVRGNESIHTDAIVADELAFTAARSPHHARFVAAAAALELDFVAFDYSLGAHGEPIVWEANPFPALQLAGIDRRYRWPAMTRAFAAMVELYHVRAGLAVPPLVDGLSS